MTSDSPLPLAVPGAASIPGVEAPRRGPVYGKRFVVACGHQLAAQAAAWVMQEKGGNAADAAIAAAAVHAVTMPHRTQLGGDVFALVWRRGPNTVDCLNAGGRAPRLATPERFSGTIPSHGAVSSSVPGFIDGLLELHVTYATLPLDTLFIPAIRHAEEGFAVSLHLWDAMRQLVTYTEPEVAGLRQAFLKDGREPYTPGSVLRQPDLAQTLREIIEEARDGFYAGPVGRRIAEAMREAGGLIDEKDLEEPTAVWDDALTASYHGVDVYEQALPSQGLILLEALNIAENFPIGEWGRRNADAAHVMIEATKLAMADSRRYTADPNFTDVPVEKMLSKEHGRARASEINLRQAGRPVAAALTGGETTQFVVADEDLAITLIQSVFHPWGARFLVPGTGILMNDRLSGFSLDPASPNYLTPGKRTVTTLNTFMAIRAGELVVGGGTPGANFQVQCNLQTVVGVLDWGLDLQSAIDGPRWVTVEDKLAIESRFGPELIADLRGRGHSLLELAAWEAWDATLSRSQVMASVPGGGWAAASDLRSEGVALAS
jgi:gamma-glutamyltranspeptidase/glutathione hydrolase